MIAPGIKRGTAELAVLSVLEDGPLHGYEMARRIEEHNIGIELRALKLGVPHLNGADDIDAILLGEY